MNIRFQHPVAFDSRKTLYVIICALFIFSVGAAALATRTLASPDTVNTHSPEGFSADPSSSLSVSSQQRNSDSTVWEFVEETSVVSTGERQIVPQVYRTARVNQDGLRQLLGKAPLEFTQEAQNITVALALPMPDGSFSMFRIEQSPIMEAPLAAQYPEIRTYRGQGLDDPAATTRLDLTPAGFHAMILSERGTIYIDPYAKGDTSNYITYFKSDYRNDAKSFTCHFTEDDKPPGSSQPVVPNVANGTILRTYRLALAATGEYTAFHGGTVPGALAAITTSINRVDGVYERDVAVRLVLVANESSIIYTNPATDPYTNGNGSTMLGQNQTNLDLVIGSANYDIGHVFSTGGGGVAFLGVVCNASFKARGVTGSGSPVGDGFDIDYVAHEMGHQFGGNHTFNGITSNCGGGNRSGAAAYETGSGSTIMAYAGICGAQNLQPNSDDYFHVKSLEEIAAFIAGTSCDVETNNGNTLPTVSAGAAVTIPKSTPFTLTAIGSDANGDALTFCWEEYDLGPSSPPDTDADGNARPIFRSFDPVSSPSRTFPKLSNILNNTSTFGEALPTINRTMNFQVTARDNRVGGGGISTATKQVVVSASAGPFLVTQPNTAVTWAGGSSQTVAWNVANTSAAPVNAANVKISLSTDGGNTFPLVLSATTPNDGTESVAVPNTPTSLARIKVEAVGNVFFDLSNSNFNITAAPARTLTVASSNPASGVAVTVSPNDNNAQGNGTTQFTRLYNHNIEVTLSAPAIAAGNTFQKWQKDGGDFSNNQSVSLMIDADHTLTAVYVCGMALSPLSQNFTAAGGLSSLNVTSGAGCAWTAVSNDSWIIVTSGESGSGNGAVNFTVVANSGAGRTGTISVLGEAFTVNQAAPTFVTLVSLNATDYNDGVFIEWRTGLEVDNLGFNLYRDDGGKRTRINDQLLAGSALRVGQGVTLGSGCSYSWWDRSPSGKSTSYWLEDIDLNGKSAWHGPVGVDQPIGNKRPASAQQARTLDELSNIEPSSAPGSSPASLSDASVRSSGGGHIHSLKASSSNTVKLGVKREGWYRITGQELFDAGLDSSVDPRKLQLFVDGKQQAICVTGQDDGRFNPTDSVEFYGLGTDSPFSDLRTYYLAAGKQPGLRVAGIRSPAHPSPSGSFPFTVERRDRTIYFSALRNGDKENFFGAVVAGQAVNQSLTLNHVVPTAEPAVLKLGLQGVTRSAHIVSVELNGADVGQLSFQGHASEEASFYVSPLLLTDGLNQVTLVSRGGPSDVSLVDYVGLTYQHSFTATDDGLKFTAAAGRQVTVDGFSSDSIRLFDVTDPYSVQEVVGYLSKTERNGMAVSLIVPGKGQRSLLALTGDTAGSVAGLAPDYSSNLRNAAQGADLLIITRRAFFESVRPLKELRQKQGLSVSVVDIEDIYDEFSFGQKTPNAVRDFLALAKNEWTKPVRYVLLFGDASLDPRNYLGSGDFDMVPTRFIDTSFMEAASDDWFADFNGDGLADVAIGRLPVRNVIEASAMIDKLIAYDGSEPSREVLGVADQNEGYDFEQAIDQLKDLVPANVRTLLLKRGQLGDAAARAELLAALNRGQKLVSYFGHGSINMWRGDLLTNEDAAQLQNNQRLSVFLMMNCLNGYFADPGDQSLSEALLKSENGGAIAVWASTAMTYPDSQTAMTRELYRQLFNNTGLRIGDAVVKAKAAAFDIEVRRTWVLLGDPSMRLR